MLVSCKFDISTPESGYLYLSIEVLGRTVRYPKQGWGIRVLTVSISLPQVLLLLLNSFFFHPFVRQAPCHPYLSLPLGFHVPNNRVTCPKPIL